MKKITERFGKWLKIDMQLLINGGSWMTLSHVTQSVSGLVLALAFANITSPEVFGTFQLILSYSAIFGALAFSGILTAVRIETAQGNNQALREGFRTKLKLGLGVVCVGTVISAYYFIQGNNILSSSFLIISIGTVLIESFQLNRAFLFGIEKFKEVTVLALLQRSITVAATIGTIFLTSNPALIVATYFGSNLLLSWLQYVRVVHKYNVPYNSGEKSKSITPYGTHLTVLNVIKVIGDQIDKIFIFHYLGAVEAAIYAIAAMPANHTLKLFNILGSLSFTRYARYSFQTIKDGMLRKTILLFCTATVILTTYLLAAPYLFSVLFPAYGEAILYSQIAMLALLIKPATLHGKAFLAHGIKKEQYFVQISMTVIQVILLAILVPIYGILGAVIATLLKRIYWSISTVVLFYRHQPIDSLD